jgi:hypothetical protein
MPELSWHEKREKTFWTQDLPKILIYSKHKPTDDKNFPLNQAFNTQIHGRYKNYCPFVQWDMNKTEYNNRLKYKMKVVDEIKNIVCYHMFENYTCTSIYRYCIYDEDSHKITIMKYFNIPFYEKNLKKWKENIKKVNDEIVKKNLE